ncbi:GNAT family N-acetyltransferase [Tsukamurella sp. 8F]|uniref:GNAT family N-acetyltransferase n=1 Tax=unclassified Tsukamurella TaxID=2633480 RepID=UPI0023B93518|nr:MULTISPECIES: GNAT family N-acetyltransferase [unclassified Tsukamurella]MDF0529707.1 GNAT family N-acetyltransferase [Tsukamurella sp. 8J]MDF0585992.1 GNAT family N-acetyltransferase [Tsukamurella sp. 8F]
MTESSLADPIRSSLAGAHARFAITRGRISRYHPEVSVFYGHPRELTADDYGDAVALAGPGGTVGFRDRASRLPGGWESLETFGLILFDGTAFEAEPAGDDVVTLTSADVPEMTALVRRTDPGPFLPRTIELGTYIGIRGVDGALLAMAGERMRPDGWTEISAVCTAPEARGRGYATRLLRAVAHGIRARGDEVFLHTGAANPARRLYTSLGFTEFSEVPLELVRVPR